MLEKPCRGGRRSRLILMFSCWGVALDVESQLCATNILIRGRKRATHMTVTASESSAMPVSTTGIPVSKHSYQLFYLFEYVKGRAMPTYMSGPRREWL